MWDFPESDTLGTAVSNQLASKRFVVAICHGPAGLSKAVDSNGDPVVKDREVAAFSNAEEVASGLDGIMPFALETRLRELGARYVGGKNFAPFHRPRRLPHHGTEPGLGGKSGGGVDACDARAGRVRAGGRVIEGGCP